MLLGAATFTNYLAAFVARGVAWWCAWLRPLRREASVLAPRHGRLIGFAVWLPADAWFFLAQRGSRAGQFAAVRRRRGVARLARYFAANLFGGLPLYLGGIASSAVTAVLGVLLLGLIVA